MEKEHLLVLCHTFPPSPGIGGKRWFNLSKQLSHLGYHVHVICNTRTPDVDSSSEHENLSIHEVSGFYPEILNKRPRTIVEKLQYRIWKITLQLLYSGGIYDRAIFFKKSVKRKMEQLIPRFDIKKVIVTCAPFSLAVYASSLKSKYGYQLVTDFRDPWTWGEGYGYSIMSVKRKSFDQLLEKGVMEKSDLITSPSERILTDIRLNHGDDIGNKLLHLPHGFDKASMPQPFKRVVTGRLRLIYAGSLYEGYDEFLNDFIQSIYTLKSHGRIDIDVSLDIFTQEDYTLIEDRIKKDSRGEFISFKEPLNQAELFQRYQEYEASVIYFPEKFKDFISTKFYELIYAGLPLIYIGSSGRVSELIETHSLGVFIQREELMAQTGSALVKLRDLPSSDFDIERFDYINLAKFFVKEVNDRTVINS